MKKQALVVMGLAGYLTLVGCTAQYPHLRETVNYSNPQAQAPASKVDYAANGMGNAPQYLLGGQAPMSGQPQQAAAQPAPPERLQPQQEVKTMVVKPAQRQERIKITGVGYGAQSTFEGFTEGQKRLMAIRSSKLDAYRSLAEQLYGIKIDSNTSVATLTAQNDSFRARVNAVVKGARIVSITPMADNNYETVLEVFVDRSFFEEVFVYTGNQHDRVLEPIETCTMGFNCYEAANYR